MRNFSYRVPRFSVSLPVQVSTGEANHSAFCTEISGEGMKLELTEELGQGSTGRICMRYEELVVRVPFRATHTEGMTCCAAFVFESAVQRQAVSQLIAELSAPRACTSLALRTVTL
jgi:hypothetical protein